MSEQKDQAIDDVIEEYALGLVSPADAREVEARMARDPEFAAKVIATRDAVTAMALSTPTSPSAALKQRVLSRIEELPPARSSADNALAFPSAGRSRASLWLGFALAASLALVTKLSFDLRSARRSGHDAAEALAARDAVIANRDSVLSALTDPGMELVTLAATGERKPMLRAYIDHKRLRMTLSAASLDAMPTGRVYQLWFIMDGKPVPSVTFTPGTDGRAMLMDVTMPSGAIAATAITVEPTGGSPLPTTSPLFVGKLAAEK